MNFPINNVLLNAIVENTSSFIGVYNVQTMKFVFINSVGLRMLNVPDIETFTHAYPHGIRQQKLSVQDHEVIMKHLHIENNWQEDVLFEKNNGQQFWGSLQISMFYHQHLPHYYIRIADISNRVKNEQQLKDDENRFEALFMHASIGIIMVDKDEQIVLSNHFADVLFGYDKGALIGNTLDLLIPDKSKAAHRKKYQNYTQKPQTRAMGVGFDLYGQRKDGTQFPVEVSLSHFTSSGTPYFIAFINDITLKKQAETELLAQNMKINKMNDSLEKEVVHRTNALVETLKTLENSKHELEIALNKEKELGELKSRFVSMASHEFRTPLTSILSASSLIEKYDKTEDQDKRQRHLNRIKSAVGNLTDILEEFLSVGKLEEGKLEPNWSSFDLPDMIHGCILDLSSLKKTEQRIDYKHIGEQEVFSDKSMLRKIVINLCSNALKFSPENTVVRLSTEAHGNSLLLIVKDQGIGISAEDQKYLFDRFFRGKNVANIQGTGLGLHIVARYAELLNGSVRVESELNVGTTFIVTFNW